MNKLRYTLTFDVETDSPAINEWLWERMRFLLENWLHENKEITLNQSQDLKYKVKILKHTLRQEPIKEEIKNEIS
jgi:hypothetical protein